MTESEDSDSEAELQELSWKAEQRRQQYLGASTGQMQVPEEWQHLKQMRKDAYDCV